MPFSPGEQHLLDDLNEFVRQTSDLLEDEPQTSGIRPPPIIEVTETTLDTTRFGFEFGPEPLAQVEPLEQPTGEECTCPREVTEISGFTMSFTAHYTGDGVTSCPEDQCSDTQTWTRIDSSESFSAPHQFKLYLNNCESGGEIIYEDNRTSSPISFDCFGTDPFVPVHGSFVYGSNSPNTGGCCNFVTVGNDVLYTMDFFAEGDNLCSNCVAELGDTDITGLTICDMSSLIGVYPISEECIDEFGGVWNIDATLEWF